MCFKLPVREFEHLSTDWQGSNSAHCQSGLSVLVAFANLQHTAVAISDNYDHLPQTHTRYSVVGRHSIVSEQEFQLIQPAIVYRGMLA